jgi:lipopolysaccharide/colanic/teichoic acid biosynthesis glycosyltransferase
MLERPTATRTTPRSRDSGASRRVRDLPTTRRGAGEARELALRINSIADEVIRTAEGYPLDGVAPRRRSETVNRAANVLLASLALVALSPVLLFVALLVRLTSRGPVIYVQERVGIDRRARRTTAMYCRRGSNVGGRVFRIYKFRTMHVDAELRSGAVWASQNDPRVTPVGRFLRRTRLDELPQLLNVLMGDMNIVGPRPERPTIFMNLRENIAAYPMRQRTRPGITGLAQINQNYDENLDDVRTKVAYDLTYLANQSMWEDIKIMARTIPVMLFRKGGW